MAFKTGNYRSAGSSAGIPISQALPEGYNWRRSSTGKLELWKVDVTPEVLLTEQDISKLDVNGTTISDINALILKNVHEIKSGGEEIIFKNLETGVSYTPAWTLTSSDGVTNSPLSGMLEGNLNTNFEPGGVAATSGSISSDYTAIIPINFSIYNFTYISAENYTGKLTFLVKDSRNEEIYRYEAAEATYTEGSNVVISDIFFRVRVGNTRTIGAYKADGSPLLVRPSSANSAVPYRKISIRTFEDRRVILAGTDGKISLSDLPELNTSEIRVVATEAERLALPQTNKLYIVTQTNAGPNSEAGFQWLLNPNTDPSVIGNWVKSANTGNSVLTFKGRSGAVEPQNGDYTASEVGAVALPGNDSVRRVLIGNITVQENLVDNLTTDSSTAVLSAKQGVVLKGFIEDITDNTLAAIDLPGADGLRRVFIGNGVVQENLVDNLTTNSNTAVLSAKQGFVLKGLVDALTNDTLAAIDLPGADGLRRVFIGNGVVQEILADNLTTNSETAVLSAKQGFVLKGLVDEISAAVESKQNCLCHKSVAILKANGVGATTTDSTGGVFTTTGTAAGVAMTDTAYGRVRKIRFSTNSTNGNTIFVRGPASYSLNTGFKFLATWSLDSGTTSNMRMFVGFDLADMPNNSLITNRTSCFGVCFENSDLNYSLIQNDSAGTAIITPLTASFPKGTAAQNIYSLELNCDPLTSVITYELIRRVGGAEELATGTFGTTNLPLAGDFLRPVITLQTAAAAAAGLGFMGLYIETNI